MVQADHAGGAFLARQLSISGKVPQTVMSDFEARTVHSGSKLVVALSGDCDLRSRDRMTAVLLDAVRAGGPVVVDLADVGFLDSSGLHALVTAHHAAAEQAGSLHVVNATGTVATVMEITGVLELLRNPAPAAGGASARPEQSS